MALKRQGKDHWGRCPFHGEKTPSFKVDPRGFFKCWGCGAMGDAIAWLEQMHGMTFAEAVAGLPVATGLRPDRAGRKKPLKRKASPERSLAGEARQLESRIRWARELWASCPPAQGSLAELYLRHRGITLTIPPTIRFHGALEHYDTGLFLPAMVAAIQDPAGRITGVHRTYLRADGLGKAQIRKPKKVAGHKKGCAVRLAATAPVMVSGEGLETTLSVMQAGDLPGWAAIDLGNMAGGYLGPGRPHPEKPGQRLPSERPGSAVSRLNSRGVLHAPPLDLVRLLADARRYSALTEGAFDVTVQPLWRLYAEHFGGEKAKKNGPDPEALATVLARVDYRAVSVDPARIAFEKPHMAITLNGIAQGYITDRVADLFRRNGLGDVLIDLGELRALGRHPEDRSWTVGLEDPRRRSRVFETLELDNTALATSAGRGTGFDASGEHHHLFEPRTGRSSNRYLSVSVKAPTATEADALSTGRFHLDQDRFTDLLKRRQGVTAIAMLANGGVRQWPA